MTESADLVTSFWGEVPYREPGRQLSSSYPQSTETAWATVGHASPMLSPQWASIPTQEDLSKEKKSLKNRADGAQFSGDLNSGVNYINKSEWVSHAEGVGGWLASFPLTFLFFLLQLCFPPVCVTHNSLHLTPFTSPLILAQPAGGWTCRFPVDGSRSYIARLVLVEGKTKWTIWVKKRLFNPV